MFKLQLMFGGCYGKQNNEGYSQKGICWVIGAGFDAKNWPDE
jgi:hypothetical protein